MPSHKALGFSGIPAYLFKQAPTPFQGRIHLLVNEILEGKYDCDQDLLMAKVILIHKDKDIAILHHHRPIALLNTIYQLINIIMTSRLRQLSEKYAVMEGSQYGFRAHSEVHMVVQRAHWVHQQAIKESGTLIRIDLHFKNAFNSAGHSCLWTILRGLGVPDVKFLEALYSNSWMEIQLGSECIAPIQLDTGTVQGSVLSPLLFDLFLNALLRLLDATGITHGIRGILQWNHAAFADDLSIYMRTVRDGNKLLDVIHEFEDCSGLRISTPKSLATGAMYCTGSERRSERAKTDTAKRKREPGPDILNLQIRALGAMDEALDEDNTIQLSTKGQEDWQMSLATMSRQCPIYNKKKGNCHFPTHLKLTPPCLECQHTWKPAGIQYKGTDLKVIHGRAPIRLLGIQYKMWLDSTARYVMDGITEMACFLRKNRDLSIKNSLRLIECTLAPLLAFSGSEPAITWPEKEFKQLTAAL